MYELHHDFEIHLIQNDVTNHPNQLNLNFSKDIYELMIIDDDSVNKYVKDDLKEEYLYYQFLIKYYANETNYFQP